MSNHCAVHLKLIWYWVPTVIGKKKKRLTTKRWWRCGKLGLSYNVKWVKPLLKMVWQFLKKAKCKVTQQFHSWKILQRNENMTTKKTCSWMIIIACQLETIQMSNWWIHWQNVTYPCGKSTCDSTMKKNQLLICYKIDEPQTHAKVEDNYYIV